MGYKKRPSDSWDKILHAKPVLTEREAKAMLKAVAKLRKESGYRNVASACGFVCKGSNSPKIWGCEVI